MVVEVVRRWEGGGRGWCAWNRDIVSSETRPPASSHMLASKSKACMYQHKRLIVKMQTAH